MTNQPDSSSSARETWMIRLGLTMFVLFSAFGVYVLFYPTDRLTEIFGALLLVTLVLGIITGLVSIYSGP